MLGTAQELIKRGVDVQLCCGKVTRHDPLVLKNFLTQHFFIEKLPNITVNLNYTLPFGWVTLLRKLNNDFKPDVIHLNNQILFYQKKTPIIMTYHGTAPLIDSDSYLKKLMSLFKIRLTTYSFFYTKVIAVSNKIDKELHQYMLVNPARSKLITIPIGLDTKRYQKYQRSSREREFAAIHVGSRKEKNLKFTLQALKIIWNTGIPLHLYIAGTENDYLRQCLNSLSNKEKTHVTYLGSIGREELLNLLGRMRLTINPSYYEAFSIATLESICCGTPALVSTAIPEEIIVHNRNGFRIANVNDINSMAKYIALLLCDNSLWNKMNLECLNISKRYDINTVVDELLALYKELTN